MRNSNVIPLSKSLKCNLKQLRRQIQNTPKSLFFSDRPFRGHFGRMLREHRMLSRQDICNALNVHPEARNLSKRYLSFKNQYPFTPVFIEQFETRIETIVECFRGGFLEGIGFPTDELTRLISQICTGEAEYEKLLSWCGDRLERLPARTPVVVKMKPCRGIL